MKKIVLYMISILVVGALAMPLVVKNNINQQIDDKKQMLEANGLELSITKEEGYFTSNREFELKIINGKKFRDYVLKRFAEKNPSYKGLTELMQKESNKDIRPALDGTTFSGNIKNSNLYLNNPMIEISLKRFSDEIMSSVDDDKDASKVVNSMLDEKLLTFFITLDKNQKISKIVMKDIDKDIDDNGEKVNVKLKDHKLDIDIRESLKGVYTLGEQSLKADEFELNTKGIEYSFDYLTQFDNSGNFHIDSIKFKEKNDIFKLNDIKISNNIKTVNDSLEADVKYALSDIYFKDYDLFELSDLEFAINVVGIDKDGAVQGTDAYNKLAFNPTKDNIEKFTKALQKVLNKGFKATLESSFNSLSFQNIDFEKTNFFLNIKVEQNNYTIESDDMVNAFFVDGKLTFAQKNIKDIINLDRSLERFVKLGKKDGSNIVFDYEFKQGKLLINGQEI